jgi:hypothetical protein
MTHEHTIRYRDPESERVVVRLLEDSDERDAFLRDRQGYLRRTAMPAEARQALLQIPDEQIRGVAAEFDYNFGVACEVRGYSSTKGTATSHCGTSTFADFFCDD